MENKIKHLLNQDEQRFIVIGGLMGSGKSTLSEQFKDVGYVIVCPDTERFILAKKEYGEDKLEGELHHLFLNYDKDAWKNAEEKFYSALKAGKSVFFDATLTTPKARRQMLAWSDRAKVKITAIYLDNPVELAVERNEKRGMTVYAFKNGEPIFGRTVPNHVIWTKNRTQSLPMLEEGFKEVIYLNPEIKVNNSIDFNGIVSNLITDVEGNVKQLRETGVLKDVFKDLNKCFGMSQDNIHHNRTLDHHMITAAKIMVERFKDEVDEDTLKLLTVSTLNHDVGKAYTKEFFGKMKIDHDRLKADEKVIVLEKNEFGAIIQRPLYKGFYKALIPYNVIDLDSNAHFYDHETVGAILIRRNLLELGVDEKFANEVYALVLHHMDLPYKLTSNKSMKKLIDKVGKHRIENLLRIRYADKMSSNTSEDFEEVHTQMLQQIKDLI